MLLLRAFEEQQWAFRIDDPLPPNGKSDPKRRLSDAVNGLNAHIEVPRLRFGCEGEGLFWRYVPPQ